MSPYIVSPDFNGEGLHIGIVRARVNEEIGSAQQEACIAELVSLGVDARDITVLSVPGALEAGVTRSHMAEPGDVDARVALRAVTPGEPYDVEGVSNDSAAAISRVALDTGRPVANGILTAEAAEQARVRAAQQGRDCARAAV